MLGGPFLINPDSLREYFNTEEEWEDYSKLYDRWRRGLEKKDDTLIIKKRKVQPKCRACGKYLSIANTHLVALGGVWHMNGKCMTKLLNYLSDNVLFSFKKDKFT
jgi:hypothetical protein